LGSAIGSTYPVVIVNIETPEVAGERFVVPHALGRRPVFVTALSSAAGSELIATTDDLAEWTATSITVRFSVAETLLRLKIE
jgi:hypothetical protein